MTASNASLSSWAAYCGSDAVVDGTNINSCLGDLFSINWMEDTEAHDPAVETLATQQATVIAKTTRSPVQTFGNFTFLDEPIGDFEGNLDNKVGLIKKFNRLASHVYTDKVAPMLAVKESTMVDSRDHNLHFLMQAAVNEPSLANMDAVHKEVAHRDRMDTIFNHEMFVSANAPETPQNFDCLRLMVSEVEEMCGDWSDYSLKYVRKLANMCDTRTEAQVAESLSHIYEL